MLNDITIRPFQDEDSPALKDLIVTDLLEINVHDYGQAVAEQMAAAYNDDLIAHYALNAVVFMAVKEEQIVGTAGLQADRVRNVFTHKDYQRQGIGRRLMAAIEDAARRQGQTRLWLRASLSAVGFYGHLGYQIVEEREEQVGQSIIKMVRMQKELD